MQNPLITFIIPAYNAASYVETCIESVFRIDLHGRNREVIAVNDGSTDSTPEVLRRCRHAHPTLRLLEQENMGLSMARNNAMAMAQGEYICFVDADDILDSTCPTEDIMVAMEDNAIDIIGISCRQTETDGRTAHYRRYVPEYNRVYTPAREFMRGKNLFPCAYAYLFRREFLQKEQLEFMPFTLHEDEDFTTRAFALADSFMAIDAEWYVRMVREESITTTKDKEKQKQKLRDVVKIIASLDNFAAANTVRKDCMACKMDYLVVDTLRLLLRQRHDIAFRKEILHTLKAMGRFPLRWRWNAKYIVFNLFTRLYLCAFL